MMFLKPYSVKVSVIYGSSECNGALGCQLFNINERDASIGHPLPGVQCLLISESGKIINAKDCLYEIGQIYIGGLQQLSRSFSLSIYYCFIGKSVFNCYLNDSIRTMEMFDTIDNKIYVKTGDLARYNCRGELTYVGRVDFQIKIRGQRVEALEIENTIMKSFPEKISNCLAMKLPQSDDHIVAYIVANDLSFDIEEIRSFCNRHLRHYMVPSVFILLEQFPLNANGKVDRKRLPMPDLSLLPMPAATDCYVEPIDEIEKLIELMWCEILHCDGISTQTNFFSIGGHSLLFIKLFHSYQAKFHFDSSELTIMSFLKQPTILEHAKLLEQFADKTIISRKWHNLNLIKGEQFLNPPKIANNLNIFATFRSNIICTRKNLT